MNKGLLGLIAVLLTLLLFAVVGFGIYFATRPAGGNARASAGNKAESPPERTADWPGKRLRLEGCRVILAGTIDMVAQYRNVQIRCFPIDPRDLEGLSPGATVTVEGVGERQDGIMTFAECHITRP